MNKLSSYQGVPHSMELTVQLDEILHYPKEVFVKTSILGSAVFD